MILVFVLLLCYHLALGINLFGLKSGFSKYIS